MTTYTLIDSGNTAHLPKGEHAPNEQAGATPVARDTESVASNDINTSKDATAGKGVAVNEDAAASKNSDSNAGEKSTAAGDNKDSSDDVNPSPGSSKGWISSVTSHLTKLISDARGGASDAVVDYIKSHLGGTKLIFVVGQSGTGKTSLLKELTGRSDLKIGHTFRSGTRNYQICPTVIHGEQYLFVDTAGFGAADLNNLGNFDDIISCIVALGLFVTVAGVLFVYGGNQERMSNDDLTTIQWVKCFCGPEFYKAVTIVTTKWDELNEKSFRRRLSSVKSLMGDKTITEITEPTHQARRYEGGVFYQHGFPGGRCDADSFGEVLDQEDQADERAKEIRDLIHRRYSKPPTAKLQVMSELAEKIEKHDTQAAKALRSDPASYELQIQDGRVMVKYRNGALAENTAPRAVSEHPNPQESSGPVKDAGDPKQFQHCQQEEKSGGLDAGSQGQKVSEPATKGHQQRQQEPQQQQQQQQQSPDESYWFQRLWGWFKVAWNMAGWFDDYAKQGGR